MSRIPECGQRRPNARTSRRWISSARWSSISCSVIDHASASHGAGAAVDAQVRVRAHRLADHRVAGEALVERPQVLVDAGGEAHPLDRGLGRRPALRAGREQHALRRGLDHRRPAPARRRRAAAAPATRRGGAGSRRRSRGRCGTATAASPRRADRPARQPRGTGSIAAQQVDVDQERVARDDLPHHALLASCARAAWRGGGSRPRRSRRRRRSRWRPARRPAARGAGRARWSSSTRVWFATTGGRRRPRSLFFVFRGQLSVVLVGHARHSMTHRADARADLAVAARRPEHAVPVRRADAEAAPRRPGSGGACAARAALRPTRVRGRWWCTW